MEIELRSMMQDDWDEVAELIHLGTNFWYQTHGMGPIFTNGPASTRLFCEVYETLDPGCCILATESRSKKIVGSCFYHPRESHVSLGIMNVHPNYFGFKIAGRLLQFIKQEAEKLDLPIRLVSSALNLDSYSLYTRAGFVPRMAFQDMWISVPPTGMDPSTLQGLDLTSVREANREDVVAIANLESELHHISRTKDFEYFVQNDGGYWKTLVFETNGAIDGFLVSIDHPGSNMIGPGLARDSKQMLSLLAVQLDTQRNNTPVFLVPVEEADMVQTLYGWGAKNCELHFSQVLGEYSRPTGVVMPTFMPETC